MSEEPTDVEILARRLAEKSGADPDHMVLPPHLVPLRIPIIGGSTVSAQGQFTPIPVWHCYTGLARELLEAGDVFL